MLTKASYLDKLLAQVPEFETVYDEHLTDNDEILHYVLIGELFLFASAAYERRDIILLARIVDFINQAALSTDEDLQEIVHVSFIEYVPHSPVNDAIAPLLNSAAMEMYHAVVDYEPTR